jgi:hypothetical protein
VHACKSQWGRRLSMLLFRLLCTVIVSYFVEGCWLAIRPWGYDG